MFRLKLRILLIIVIFISIENLYAEGGDRHQPEEKKKSGTIAPKKIISTPAVEIPKKPEIIEVPKNPQPIEVNQKEDCMVNPDHDGYYKLRESINLIRPGGKIETTLKASPSKPKIVYVEDLDENEGPGKWAIKIKVFDNEHNQALPENGGFLYVSCKYFYQQVKNPKETPEAYEERKRTAYPEVYDFPDLNNDTDTPTEDEKGLLAAIEEMIKKAQKFSWTTKESCVDDKPSSSTSKIEEIIPIKTKEEANKYFECYRRTETSQDEYLKKYQPVIESISKVAQRLISDNEEDDAQNKNDFERVLSCLIFRESDHWTGKNNKGSGAVGFGQFTTHGIDKIRNILQRISNYKSIDYQKEEAIIQKKYDEAYDKKNAERESKDNELEKMKEVLSVLQQKKGKTKQDIQELDKLNKEISVKKVELRKIDRELVSLDDENEKERSLNREKAINAISTNKLKVLWDAFWEKNKGKHKKPDLEKIKDWKNPPSSLMASKDFLAKKENYEISFLYTSLTLLDDFQDLKLSADSICDDKNLTTDQKPTNVETLIGATGMYNLGPNGFMTKAFTFKDPKTGEKDWSVRLDDQLQNLKKSGYFQRVEGVNHMLSVKRCAEAGKNQPPCDTSVKGPIPEPNCNWAMPDSPPNRSMCENKMIHLCVRGKTRNYECPTKK